MHKVFEQAIPKEELKYLQDYTLFVKELCEFYQGKPKANGSGQYWQGIDMASRLPLATDIQNEKLYSIYTSEWMHKLVTKWIPNPYLFNDQIVVKMPGEQFDFKPHRDNQFGPLPDNDRMVTQNFMLVLDDFTEENGALKIRELNTWYTLLPKAGDIVMIEGNTVHASGNNESTSPRRAYLCHYTDRPIGQHFQMGYHYKQFTV